MSELKVFFGKPLNTTMVVTLVTATASSIWTMHPVMSRVWMAGLCGFTLANGYLLDRSLDHWGKANAMVHRLLKEKQA